jgi:Ca-activated chloride channel family protein
MVGMLERPWWYAALLLALAVPLRAQQPPQPRLTESYSVGYVMIPFTALDAKGKAVADLRERDVHLMVDGSEVKTNLFEKVQKAPVSFTILVDGSGSMGLAGKMDAARTAVDSLLDQRLPGDDFSVFLFSDGEARELVPFTTDLDAVRNTLWTVKPWGKTAFFDALSKMPDRSREGANPTRAIVLLSDGIDNASSLTRAELERRLEGVNVPIYSLGLREVDGQRGREALIREDSADLQLLDRVAALTGGRMFLGTGHDELQKAVADIQTDLRSQYLVGFSPTGKGEIKYRPIALKFAKRIGSVRVRAGYRGTEPPLLSQGSPTRSANKIQKGRS